MKPRGPRVFDLAAARPEGWYEQVLQQSPDFERAGQLIGRNTLALALIAGARIASLTPHPQAQNLTTVEFSIGADPTNRQVGLPEFRETIAQYLLAPLPNTMRLPANALTSLRNSQRLGPI